MIIAISGSRTYHDYGEFKMNMNRLLAEESYSRLVIVSGGAKGVDTLARKYCGEMGIEFIEVKAKWHDMSEPCLRKTGRNGSYNAFAGLKRNKEMAEMSDKVYAFWDGKSKGTKNMITKSRKLGKPVTVIDI